MTQNDNNTSTLSPIGTLFSDSWKTMTKSILQVIMLNVLGIAICVVFGIAALIIVVLSGVASTLLQKGAYGLLSLSPSVLTTLGIFGVIFFIIFILISIALQITTILIFAQDGQSSLINKFKKSFSFILPLFLIGIVTWFLTVGGFFLLIIPGILIAILLGFSQFEIILNNQRGLNALRRSTAIISKNFGGIFVRYLILFLIVLGYTIIIGILEGAVGEEAKGILGLINFIINIIWGWFSLSFSIKLYKQAKATVHENNIGSLNWMWIVAILGWLIVGALGFAGYKAFSSGMFKDLAPKAPVSIGTSMQNSIDTMNPEAKIHYDKSAELFKQIQDDKNDPKIVKKLNDENIIELKKAAELDPQNPRIWYNLGNAYTWISTSGSWDDVLASYQKAATLDPQNTIYIDAVADALNGAERYDEAVLQLQNSLRIAKAKGQGESGLTHYRLGVAYLGLKIYDSSKENFGQAIDILEKENTDGGFDTYILQAKKYLSSMPK